MGDFNADGTLDAVVGTGPGLITRVRVLDGANGKELFAVQPFEAAFTSAVHGAAELAVFEAAVSTAFAQIAA